MMEKVMRVAVRVRPLLPAELRQNREICAHVESDSGQVILAGGHAFPCDFAYGPTVSQESLYCSSIKPLVASFFAGVDVMVLTYGQSGSGKTYTLISGRHSDSEGDRGVLWRVCEDVFQMTAQEHTHLILSVCCVALCGDELRDLLGSDDTQLNLRIMEDRNGRTGVEGAVEIPLSSLEDLRHVLECVSDVNHQHSSSHTLFWLRLRWHLDSSSQDALLSTLLLVDLAGWERDSGLVNAGTPRFKRSLQIGTELRTLADMIQRDTLPHATPRSHTHPSRAPPSRAHTPCTPLTRLDSGSDSPTGHRYAAYPSIHCTSAHTHTHSPLMRLLQNSLSGSAHTLLLVCVSPAQSSLTDTVSCLMLAARAQDKSSRTDLRGAPTRTHTPPVAHTHGPLVPHTHGPLVHHAAHLLEDLLDSPLSPSLQQRLSGWLDAYKETLSPSHGPDRTLCETYGVHQSRTPADTAGGAETDVALTQDASADVQSLQDLKQHCRLQSELLVEQKLLADWLKRDLRASDTGGQRIQSSPLTNQQPAHLTRQPVRCGSAGSRKAYSSPCDLSLERLSATMKTSNQLLLAQLEEQEQVLRLPSVTRGRESQEREEPEKSVTRGRESQEREEPEKSVTRGRESQEREEPEKSVTRGRESLEREEPEKKDKKRTVRSLLNRTFTRKHATDANTSTPDPQGTSGLRRVCEGQARVCDGQSVLVSELLMNKALLEKRRDDLSGRLTEGNTHTEQDDRALHQLEETIEAVDAVIGLRRHPDQQGATGRQLSESSAAVGSLRVLKELSLQEAEALFHVYFSKAVCLRESCASQQRRVCELEELLSVEREQSSRRLQQLEKEVFFYRSSSRELRRRLKDLVQDAPSPPSSRASCTRGSGDGGHSQGGAPD